MSPKGSAPTLPMKLAVAPKRAAAIAWFEPLPPGPSVAPSPASVSCQCGSRGTRLVRSAANRPRTVMRCRGIGRLPPRPYAKTSAAGIDHDIDAPVLLAAIGIVSVLARLTRWGWTEYALYYLCAEQQGMLPEFHAVPGSGAPKRLMCPSAVWSKFQFEGWNVEECFDPAAAGFFTLVQSNTRIPPETIRQRLAGHLEVQSGDDGRARRREPKDGAPSRI